MPTCSCCRCWPPPRGGRGARFAWESAADGTEVTPLWATDRQGNRVRIRTGELEDHIVADVAWAACRYADWTGDAAVLDGPGRALLLEGARDWASRVRRDQAGRAHIDGVIGPDEYHVEVDDNAFTNVMARWNLRRAAELAEPAGGATAEEVVTWRSWPTRWSTATTPPPAATASSPASTTSSHC